jgi:hypothetical protein
VFSNFFLLILCLFQPFSFWNRRHHCRKCGALVCSEHLNNKEIIPHISKTQKQKICDNCFSGKTVLPKAGDNHVNPPAATVQAIKPSIAPTQATSVTSSVAQPPAKPEPAVEVSSPKPTDGDPSSIRTANPITQRYLANIQTPDGAKPATPVKSSSGETSSPTAAPASSVIKPHRRSSGPPLFFPLRCFTNWIFFYIAVASKFTQKKGPPPPDAVNSTSTEKPEVGTLKASAIWPPASAAPTSPPPAVPSRSKSPLGTIPESKSVTPPKPAPAIPPKVPETKPEEMTKQTVPPPLPTSPPPVAAEETRKVAPPPVPSIPPVTQTPPPVPAEQPRSVPPPIPLAPVVTAPVVAAAASSNTDSIARPSRPPPPPPKMPPVAQSLPSPTDSVSRPPPPPPATSSAVASPAPATPSSEISEDDPFRKYIKMKEMLPPGAVRQKLTADGFNANDIDDFLSGKIARIDMNNSVSSSVAPPVGLNFSEVKLNSAPQLSKTPPRPVSGKMSLLEQIQKGPKLRAVVEEVKPQKTQAAGGLLGMLAMEMSKRRFNMNVNEEDDDDSDSGFSDSSSDSDGDD